MNSLESIQEDILDIREMILEIDTATRTRCLTILHPQYFRLRQRNAATRLPHPPPPDPQCSRTPAYDTFPRTGY